MIPDVVAFDEVLDGGLDRRAVLGGKGAGLSEMVQELKLPVPPGFTITTAVCREFLAGGWPERLDQLLTAYLERVGAQLGRRFGDPENPLLVSVRSGAPVSMPGMMDTLLNVGMTPAIRERLATTTENEAWAADTWLRFVTMYAEIVLGVPHDEVAEAEAAAHGSGDSAEALVERASKVQKLASEYGGIPGDPRAQLRGAVEAVFRSWNSQRARVFRNREGIAEDIGTAVTVQAMVFGNYDDRSGTGVAFTRDPATGAPEPYGDYLARAQGEDVVAGTHSVGGLASLSDQLPDVDRELRGTLDRLERHYRDLCDVEFTVSEGKLYILQTRVGRRSPLAAVRIAVQMAEDPGFPLTREEAVERIDQSILQDVAGSSSVETGAEATGRGLAASPGVGVGVLCCEPGRAAGLAEAGTPVVLAREQTSPSDVHGMVGAAAIVTTLGGVASHAAVVARSWAIPAITSLADAVVEEGGLRVGGLLIAEGETVTVDGTGGGLYLGDRRSDGRADVPEVRQLREWAAQLGIEPGTGLKSEAATDGRDVSLYEVVRTVQLKGLCTAERVAECLRADTEAVARMIEGSEELFRATPRGTMLTPDGRAWATEQLSAERELLDGGALEGCYERFLGLNTRFKQLVTDWQRASADEAGGDWGALVASVEELHSDFSPLLADVTATAGRLGSYTGRFEAALGAMHDGDRTMLAAPLKDSYHTVWFEYHEELIALCGKDRAVEERGGA